MVQAPAFPTLPAFLTERLAAPRAVLFAQRAHGGRPEQRLSSAETLRRAAGVAHALQARGIGRGARVAIAAQNSVDWIVADLGALLAGAVVVPIFPTLAADQLRFVLEDSAARLVFVDDTALAARLRAACPVPPEIVTFADDGGANAFAAFLAPGLAAHDAQPDAFRRFAHGADAGELAVLMYTSGTTGMPKGVRLSHGNLTSTALAAFADSGIAPGDVVLSVLPFAHIYEHLDVLGYLAYGASVWVTTPEHLLDDLRAIRPVQLAVVPRILERVLAGIVGGARAAGGIKAPLVPWALATGAAYERERRAGGPPGTPLVLAHALAHALVLRKIRPALGLDRARYLVSGSAPLHADTAFTLAGCGIEIVEGYGLTETSPVITCNRPHANRLGTVGPPIPGVEVRIAADGEIEVRGPNVMLGYAGVPDEEQPFTADGWFCTGDIGRLDETGALVITDRKREIFKTSGGKWISPARIETAIKRSVYVGQVLCVGNDRPHPAVLVAPNWDLVRRVCGAASETTAALAARADVRALVVREVVAATADLAAYERVARVALLPRDLTIEDGELSPTMKIKRRVVEQRFGDLVEAAYAEDLHARAPAPPG